ncbi:MAG TPA: PAS domain-containing protein [Fimbriimonadaceae bacterium]|nr:PAS domain-containing protein [Fimbriimonadaceae bacterium]
MARPKPKPRDEQRRFESHELFFSTTDRAGVIRSGNEVFRRIAAFDSIDEMIGLPHNVIRHPDMPRAVFKLFWDFLESGKPVAAYVKNLAQDGAYYWVVALATPIEDGYLSVRFKPSSPYFDAIKDIYKELLATEAESGNKAGLRQEAMERAGIQLTEILREKGFDSYDEFMRMMLATEMSSREKAIADHIRPKPKPGADPQLERSYKTCLDLEQKLDVMFRRVESFLSLIEKLESSSAFMGNLSGQVHLLSLNSLISSHQMADSGKSLTVIANELAVISGHSTSLIDEMTTDIHALVSALREAAFEISGTKLQVGISITFLEELLSGKSDAEASERERNDLETLGTLLSRAAVDLKALVPLLSDPMSKVIARVGDLAVVVRSLSRVHLIGRVEAAHVSNAARFLELFDEVAHQLTAAQSELRSFTNAIHSLSDGLPKFESDGNVLQAELDRLEMRAA